MSALIGEKEMDRILEDINNHHDIDWKKIKEILCAMVEVLQLVCDSLPPCIIKKILCGVASLLELLCNKIAE